ncbi:MAG: peptidoglycan DD-metalloendopeptidase family protein [Clostridia bacterium]|nr:peptidoglycan DD-metalloendopeptidase family protein [Clostridia bacterium]
MEDLQKQHKEEGTVRRRRAVRSVPMGTAPTAQPDAPIDVPVPAPDIQTAPSSAAEPPLSLEDALSGAFDAVMTETADVQADAASPEEKFRPSADIQDPAELPDLSADAVLFPPVPEEEDIPEPVQVPQTPSDDAPSEAQDDPMAPSALRPLLTVLGAAAAVLLLCLIAVLPFLGKHEAVMLYIDETPIGYVSDAADADAQHKALSDRLAAEGLPMDAPMPYRCETEASSGTPAMLSDGEIYDALYAYATDGYVRAFRLIPVPSLDLDTAAASVQPLPSVICHFAAALTETEILSAIDAAAEILDNRYAANLPADTVLTVTPCFDWAPAWVPEASLLDEGALLSMLVAQEDAYPMMKVTAVRTETVPERIPYDTTLVPNDENYDGIRSMISAGADGLAQVSYTLTLDAATGAVLTREEASRVVVREPVAAVAYEGLYPLPDGVSTGTFAWPLPPLPDDELPLDENGNPYTPENPLALKNTYISSGYGERLLWGANDFHLGLDIVAPAYTEIYAADGGVVVFAAHTSSYGYMTRIRHANNVETVYAHQIKQVVKPGDVVEKGQLIGYVGSTGTSSGCHLHLEFRCDHVTVDPLTYIEIPEDILVLGEDN